jgi:4-amino-4-deoxy-L-arabinose transferase-like glycosyltransferase
VIFFLCFAIGVALRWKIFALPVREGDEQVYKALVEYVLVGQPYSMSTHPLVTEGVLSASIYGAKVFYHPPAGIYFFSLFALPWRLPGLKLAQLVCFAIFYWSLYGCTRELFPRLKGWRLACLAPLFALTPIIAHIGLRIWIDNPKMAFFTLFLFLLLLARRKSWAWWAAGVLGVVTVLTKVDALVGFPFAFLFLLPGDRATLRRLALVGGAAVLAAFAWSLYAETIFHAPSMPTPESMALNRYSWETTVGISPGIFVLTFFKVVTSVLPAGLVLLLLRKRREKAGPGEIALVAVLGIVLVYFFLCAFGYAKLLRYLCITAPFAALLVASALEKLDFKRKLAWPLAALLFLGMAAEIGQGVNILVNKPRIALVEPAF